MTNIFLKQYLRLIALLLFVAGGVVRAEAPLTVEQTRAAFLAMIDRPRVELAAEQREEGSNDGVSRFHFTYASEAGQRVPGILFAKNEILASGKHPVAIVLHGTGGKKEGNTAMLNELAAKGIVAVSIDGRYHGERGKPADYNAAIAKAFTDGGTHPLYYDTVWDVLRLVDYLQTRPEVDGSRIGLMGISKGGIETWMAAAADPRIAVAIPAIAVQSFEWGLENDGWHARVGTVQAGFDASARSQGVTKPDAKFVREFYDHVLPGIHDQFDCPVMLTLIAPRPLLVTSGETDPNNPLPGMRIAEQSAIAAYAKAGAADKFMALVEPKVGHSFTKTAQAAAVDWFVKWLKP